MEEQERKRRCVLREKYEDTRKGLAPGQASVIPLGRCRALDVWGACGFPR